MIVLASLKSHSINVFLFTKLKIKLTNQTETGIIRRIINKRYILSIADDMDKLIDIIMIGKIRFHSNKQPFTGWIYQSNRFCLLNSYKMHFLLICNMIIFNEFYSKICFTYRFVHHGNDVHFCQDKKIPIDLQ